MKKQVLVTGATGSIGRILVKNLVEHNFSVRIFVRNKPDLSCLPEKIEIFTGDITSARDLENACTGIDTVFHLAAKLHINNPSVDDENEIFRINTYATKLLCEAAWKKNVRRFVFFSTINVYGVSGSGKIFDEKSEPRPLTAYAESKFYAEKYVENLVNPETGRQCGTVLRLAAVYGPNMRGNYRLLEKMAQFGIRLVPGNADNRRTMIHENDVVDFAMLAACHPDAGGKIFNLADGKNHTLETIFNFMLESSGKRTGLIKIPLKPCMFLAESLDFFIYRFSSRRPLQNAFSKFTEDMAVNGSLAHDFFDFRPETAMRRNSAEL